MSAMGYNRLQSRLVRAGNALHGPINVTVALNAANQAVAHGLVDHVGNKLIPQQVIIVGRDAVGCASVYQGATASDATNIYLSNANATTAGVVDVYVA